MPVLDDIAGERKRLAERLARLDADRQKLADQIGELDAAARSQRSDGTWAAGGAL
jgi:hypothetical protein